jgi:Concanavalin A-like lectin/glucanases superfamily
MHEFRLLFFLAVFVQAGCIDMTPPWSGGGSKTSGGPFIYYPCDQSAGTVLLDASGFGNNARIFGDATFAPGKLGQALTLTAHASPNESLSGYAELPAGFLPGITDMTVASWVKLAANPRWQRVFDFGSSFSNNMFLTTNNQVAGVSVGPVHFAISLALPVADAGGVGNTINVDSASTAAGTLPDGVWKHVAVVLSAGSGTTYVDGTAVGTNGAMSLHPGDLQETTNNWIGKSQFAGAPQYDPYFNGQIDDFRVYDRALSAVEIAALAGM